MRRGRDFGMFWLVQTLSVAGDAFSLQPDGIVGYVLAAAGVGTVAGALVVARARRTLGFGGTRKVRADLTVTAAIVTTFGFATTIAGICSQSLRQEVTAAFWTIHYSTPGRYG
jgi:hypothetical protein